MNPDWYLLTAFACVALAAAMLLLWHMEQRLLTRERPDVITARLVVPTVEAPGGRIEPEDLLAVRILLAHHVTAIAQQMYGDAMERIVAQVAADEAGRVDLDDLLGGAA